MLLAIRSLFEAVDSTHLSPGAVVKATHGTNQANIAVQRTVNTTVKLGTSRRVTIVVR